MMRIYIQVSLIPLILLLFATLGSADAWCKAGFKDCDYNYQNGCETCIKNDVKNCGDCGVKCPSYPYSSPTCSNGKCGITCSPGWSDCNKNMKDGCEANTKSDSKNCGKCGVSCQTYPYSSTKCNNGKCEYVCNKLWKDCNNNMQDGCETDVGQDVKNCGGCGVSCPTYPYSIASCSGGKCGSKCTSGWSDCDGNKQNGCETDVGQDVKNCGGCGVSCPTYPYSIASCSGGKCGSKCTSGWSDCDGNKQNGCETDVGKDVNNCGGCGKKCPCTDGNALPTCR
jgi:hypothetical protein